ncbi:MAG: hypothetical protein AAF702_35115 [Chloroflexota bacterium]
MQPIPQTAPISNFRKYQDDILEMMDKEPVILMNRATPRAVLVNPEAWNATARELNKLLLRIEELEDSVEVWRGLYELETGKDKIVPADIEELEKAAGRVPA